MPADAIGGRSWPRRSPHSGAGRASGGICTSPRWEGLLDPRSIGSDDHSRSAICGRASRPHRVEEALDRPAAPRSQPSTSGATTRERQNRGEPAARRPATGFGERPGERTGSNPDTAPQADSMRQLHCCRCVCITGGGPDRRRLPAHRTTPAVRIKDAAVIRTTSGRFSQVVLGRIHGQLAVSLPSWTGCPWPPRSLELRSE